MDYDSVYMFNRKIGDKDITNRKIGDGKMMGNMYYLPIKVQNSNYSGVTEHDHLPQVDKEHPKSCMDIHLTRGNASGFWSLTVLPGGQGFLGRLGAPRDLFEFQVRGCSQGFLRGSFGRA